jgi:hypothetical protein
MPYSNAYTLIGRWRNVVFHVVWLVLIVAFAAIIVPGLFSGKKLVGYPTFGAIGSSGGFHCAGDGPNHIHYHTCSGAAVPLPKGSRSSDFPYVG